MFGAFPQKADWPPIHEGRGWKLTDRMLFPFRFRIVQKRNETFPAK